MQKITFVDNGQDFLRWVVKDGVVVDCQPFQSRIWCGKKVKIQGRQVFIDNGGESGLTPLKHCILKTETPHPQYVKGFNDSFGGVPPTQVPQDNEQYVDGYHAGWNSQS